MIGTGWFLLGAPWDCSGTDRGEARALGALRAAGLSDRVDVDLAQRRPSSPAATATSGPGSGRCPTPSPRRTLWRLRWVPACATIPGGGRWSSAATTACFSASSPCIGGRTGRRARRVLTIGAPEVIEDPHGSGTRAAAWAERPGVPMWLHLDVDVLDPDSLPAVTYPQPGGPDAGQLAAVLAPLTRAPDLLGVSIADFRPDLDPDGRHAATLIDLLDRALFS